jgi:hypothetical protein
MKMKQIFVVTALISVTFVSLVPAQTAPISEPTGQKTLAATMGVYVFPAEGQSPDQQSKHEAECYTWATETTKSDPFELAKRAQEQQAGAEQQKEAVQEAGQGAGAKGALAGAAVGALIGEIASDDAGEGAARGAAVGMIGARRRTRRKQQEATQQIEQQTQQVQQLTKEQIEGFKKAFGVCLEAKKYLVKL